MRNAFGQPQSVLVLGGTSDIALAVLDRLCGERTRTVVLAGRDETRLAAATERLLAAGATTVECVPMEASDPSSAPATIEAGLAAAGGRVDLVIVAASILTDQLEVENDPAAISQLFDINLTWPAAALAALRPRLLAQGSGQVAIISSVGGVLPRRDNYSYGATKAGLDFIGIGYGDSLRDAGIKVQVFRPGFVRSKMTTGLDEAPMTIDVSEAADAIVAGIASNASVIWVPSKLRLVFGVMRHLPRPLFRLVASRR